MSDLVRNTLKGWLPYKLANQDSSINCRWLFVDKEPFTEPFFDETILRCLQHANNSSRFKVYSSLEMLKQWGNAVEKASPSAIIFHVSRCGSTALGQMLAVCKQNTILSEVPLFDELLRLQFSNLLDYDDKLLACAINLYVNSNAVGMQQAFIKTDCWHLFFYEAYRNAYPNVPFFLLYRHPSEVLRSHKKRKGMHMVSGMLEKEIFNFTEHQLAAMQECDYPSLVIQKYLERMLQIAQSDNNTFLLNYSEGIETIIEKIAGITSLSFSAEERALMKQRSVYHAKYPAQIFKEEYADDELSLSLKPAMDLYHQLEAFRMKPEIL